MLDQPLRPFPAYEEASPLHSKRNTASGTDLKGGALAKPLPQARCQGSPKRSLAALLAGLACYGPSQAEPVGGNITAGSGSISQTGLTTTINQNSQRLAIDWSRFGIRGNETVRFAQPNAQAIALNRVTGRESSSILGSLIANGNVFILNPNGVLIGSGAQVNVGGLVASTLDISNADFEAGRYQLAGSSTASVANQGTITVPPGGKVALIAPSVANTGQINAPQGSVLLAAANGVSLKLADGSPIGYTLTQGAAQALVDNGGMVLADGGKVVLTAKGLEGLNNAVINHSGIVQARTVSQRNGSIELLGDAGSTALVSGTLDASGQSAGDSGGTVKVLGQKVGLFGTARLDTSGPAGGGTVLVGGNQQGLGPEPNADAAYMASTATIDASATQAGNGGKVVVWGTDVANVHGRIQATGGAQGGNGGAVETSGHALDTNRIEVDVSAAQGTGGLWLLDPYNVTISSGAQTGGVFTSNVWAPTASGSLVNTGNIQTILNAGGSVTITTVGAGAQEGNIAINGNILKNVGSAATLTLIADGRITSNATVGSHRTITSTSNALNVAMTANATTTAAGNNGLKLQFVDITANGGNISLTATGAQNGTASALQFLNGFLNTTGTGNINITGTMPSNGNSQGVVMNSATLTTASGAITVQGTSGGTGTITGVNGNGASLMSTNNTGVKLTGSNTLQSTSGGNISLTGTATGAVSTWAGGGVEIGAGDTISTTGAVNIIGTVSNPVSTTYRNQLSTVNFAGNTSTAINVTGGTVNISGTNTTVGQAGTTSNSNAGLKLAGKINITSTTGAVNLSGSNAGGDGVWGSGTANATVSISAPTASSVNINAAALDAVNGYTGFYVGGNATLAFLTTAPVHLASQTAETSTHNSIWNKGFISTPGNLVITSTGGAISDDAAANAGVFSNVGGTTHITSTGGGNAVSLNHASNKFTGAVSINAGTTSLVNSTALSLGSSTIAGALTLTAPGITQTGAITASGATTLHGGGGAISLTNAGNDFSTLSANNAAGVTVVDANALGITAIASTNTVQLTTLTQNLTTSGSLAVSNGDLALTAGANTARGTSTGGDVVSSANLSVDSGKKIYVYSGALGSTSLGGSLATQAAAGSGNFRYNKQAGDAPGASSVGDGTTYVLYREHPTLTVTPTDPSKVYDKNATTDPSLGYTISGQVHGDTASQILSGSLVRSAGQNVGSYSISQGSLADQLGYQTSFSAGHSFTITPATLTVSGTSAASKIYDGNTVATVSGGTLSGVVTGDTVTLGQSGSFDTRDVGTGKTVTAAFSLGGSGASNYVLASSSATTTADITPKALTVAANAASKVYDNNAATDPSLAYATSGLVSGDSLTGTLSRAGGQNAGSYAIGQGSLANGNYSIAFTGNTFSITPAPLTISANNASRLVGQNNPSFSATYSGFVAGESAGASDLTGSLAFSTGAGSNSVPGSYAVVPSGLGSNNYQLHYVAGTLRVLPASMAAVTLGSAGLELGYAAALSDLPRMQTGSALPMQQPPTLQKNCGGSLASAGPTDACRAK